MLLSILQFRRHKLLKVHGLICVTPSLYGWEAFWTLGALIHISIIWASSPSTPQVSGITSGSPLGHGIAGTPHEEVRDTETRVPPTTWNLYNFVVQSLILSSNHSIYNTLCLDVNRLLIGPVHTSIERVRQFWASFHCYCFSKPLPLGCNPLKLSYLLSHTSVWEIFEHSRIRTL